MAVSFFLAMWTMMYIIFRVIDAPVAPEYTKTCHLIFAPFVTRIHQTYGVHFFDYYGHKMDEAFNILVFYAMMMFIVFLFLSTCLHRTDIKLQMILQQIKHRLFLWHSAKTEKKIIRTSLGNVYQPETGAVVGIYLENIAEYPALKAEIEQIKEKLRPQEIVYNEQEYLLLVFSNSLKAIGFVRDTYRRYKTVCKTLRIRFEVKPSVKIVMHSLNEGKSLYEEESFVSAMLKCVAPNRIYLSANAKEQLDMHSKTLPTELYEIVQVGTFERLGDRTFPDIYQIKSFDEGREKVS